VNTTVGRDDILLYITALLGVLLPGLVFVFYSRVHAWFTRKGPFWLLRATDDNGAPHQTDVPLPTKQNDTQSDDGQTNSAGADRPALTVLYGSEMGTAEKLAYSLANSLVDTFTVYCCDIASVDIDDILALNETVFVFVLSTWVGGAPPEACRPFFDWLHDRQQSQDDVLATWKFAVFGVGNSIYGERVYNAAASTLYSALSALHARPFMPLAFADENKLESIEHQFLGWQRNLTTLLNRPDKLDRVADALARAQNISDDGSTSPTRVRKRHAPNNHAQI